METYRAGSNNGRSREIESDPAVLSRRQKQIDYGKNTVEYANYLKAVPVNERGQYHPRTPNLNRKYSRRAWDGLVKRWRLNLHCWTYPEAKDLLDMDSNGNDQFNCVPGVRHNESFCSNATTQSTSTTSSMDQSLLIFKEYELNRQGSSQSLTAQMQSNAFDSQPEFQLFPPTNGSTTARPSSSLCFSDFRHEDISRPCRQSLSEQDLLASQNHNSMDNFVLQSSLISNHGGNNVGHGFSWRGGQSSAANNAIAANSKVNSEDFFSWFLKN